MKYYIISGEASGDLHGGNLIHHLMRLDSAAQIRGWGGEHMQEEGAVIVKHYKDLAFMGFTEVLMNLNTILKNIKFCKKDILEFKPDVLILVDYPGFNLRIAEFAHKNGIKVFYYISPQIWAWKQGRVHLIKKVVDRMFVILPFEREFYKQFDYDVSFPGHPLLDAIQKYIGGKVGSFDEKAPKRITLLPGSRKQEIQKILPIMLGGVSKFQNIKIRIGVAPSIPLEFYQSLLNGVNAELFTKGTYELLSNSDAALVTSGTATLETALFNVPQVVCYKGGFISYLLAKRFIKVKYISLVNLILNKEAVPELIQDDMNEKKIALHLEKILCDTEFRRSMLDDYNKLKTLLGGPGASERAAEEMISILNKV
ncbi:MAG: lipid-A-disaccharide synthase [Bacteroidia bacterium]